MYKGVTEAQEFFQSRSRWKSNLGGKYVDHCHNQGNDTLDYNFVTLEGYVHISPNPFPV
jgi:hypothetical protein